MDVIMIKGKVKFPLTLDPGVWIFDERKIDLNEFFAREQEEVNKQKDYTKKISQHWNKELKEGATPPADREKEEGTLKKEALITGTFGISFSHFLKNAEPLPEAKTVIIEAENGETKVSLTEAEQFLLKFAQDGKPLRDDGPVHILSRNFEEPIKNVKGFRIE